MITTLIVLASICALSLVLIIVIPYACPPYGSIPYIQPKRFNVFLRFT